MTADKIHVSDLHFDHKLWINELKFFEMQLVVFQERLEEIVARFINNSNVLAEIEAFQNRIIRQNEVIDEIKHKIRLREQDLENISNDKTIGSDHIFYKQHDSEREEMDTFIKLYQDMRISFMQFLKDRL